MPQLLSQKSLTKSYRDITARALIAAIRDSAEIAGATLIEKCEPAEGCIAE
jgi:hypothetical protein